METSLIVLRQVVIILILLAVGGVSYKVNLISEKAADDMAAFALKIVTPCVIIESFQIDFDPKKLFNMAIACLLAVFTHAVGIIIARLFFKGEGYGNPIRRFATVYCNCGFMGIPLIQGAVGSEGVIYSCVYMLVFQVLIWSHGVVTVKGGIKNIRPYKIFVNAGTIGIALGLPLFFFSVSLPPVLSQSVHHIANLNTPLAMIVSGVYIAKSDLKKALSGAKNYLCVALRQLVIPAFVIAAVTVLRVDKTVAITLVLLSACPSASATTLFASLYGSRSDLECASRTMTLSNVLAAVTIPAVSIAYSFFA